MVLRVLTLIYKEFLQIRRDRVLLTFLLLAPVLQLALLARVTGQGIQERPLAVLDWDNTAQTRRVIAALENTETLTVCCRPQDRRELEELLQSGEAELGVVIPRGFTRDLQRGGGTTRLQAIADGANTVVAVYAMAAAEGALARLSTDLSAAGLDSGSTPVDLRVQVLYNPSLDARFYTIPAQVGFIIYQVTLTLAAVGLAREREVGTLEQLIIAPLRRHEIIMGKALAPVVVGLIDFSLMLLIAMHGFDVPMRGSMPLLLVATLLFVVTETAAGLLLSTLARTQQQAVLLVFVQAMLDMTFSGYLVPVDTLPSVLRLVSNVVPMRHYLALIRAIMLKGATLDVVWPNIAALTVLAGALVVLSTVNLSRHLD